MTILIDMDLCNGCKRCERTCPYGGVEVVDGKAHILERCTSCGACIEVCKEKAISSDAQPKAIPDFSDRKGVWVFAEQRQGALGKVTPELLGKAQELAETLNHDVAAILIGQDVKNLADELMEWGADKVYLADAPELKDYRTGAYSKVICELVERHKPNILLMGATHIGRDLAPRVSRRVGVGLTADCTELTIDPNEGLLLQTRPAFGGNVMATIANRYSRPQMATVRPGVMEARKNRKANAVCISHQTTFTGEEIGTTVLEIVKEKKRDVDLAGAKTIVAGGRGVGDEKGFRMLRDLAALMDGEVAGTRVAVEEGWITSEEQVGQTGQSVRPELYIACGISGAIQHRAGMMNSRYIVAINRDPRAAIFQVADWGIVGDLREVIPEMIRQLKGK
jgi:electron transfer flavoprotein alpha subunit